MVAGDVVDHQRHHQFRPALTLDAEHRCADRPILFQIEGVALFAGQFAAQPVFAVAAGPPPRSTGPAKTLYTVLGALGRYLQRSEVSLAELFWPAEAETSEDETPGRETLEDRVRAAYARLAPRPGGWVRLAELRAALGDARGDVDTALTALSRAPGVSVIPEEDQKKLTPDDRAAAVMIGDRPKHLIAIEA